MPLTQRCARGHRHSELVAKLEQTSTLLWSVRLYKNEKDFPTLTLPEFDEAMRKHLRRRNMLECQAVEVYGQMCPILPERYEMTHLISTPSTDDDETCGLKDSLERFSVSELYKFAEAFTGSADPDDSDCSASLSTALDSPLPKVALINHLISPRAMLNMIILPHDRPLPDEPVGKSQKDMSSSALSEELHGLTFSDLLGRVDYHRSKGNIGNGMDRRADDSDNPKDFWIDTLLRIEGGTKQGYKSKWTGLRDTLDTLKGSLYMTTAGLRDLSASKLKLRALDDAGVTVDELEAAIANEMWQRALDDTGSIAEKTKENLEYLIWQHLREPLADAVKSTPPRKGPNGPDDEWYNSLANWAERLPGEGKKTVQDFEMDEAGTSAEERYDEWLVGWAQDQYNEWVVSWAAASGTQHGWRVDPAQATEEDLRKAERQYDAWKVDWKGNWDRGHPTEDEMTRLMQTFLFEEKVSESGKKFVYYIRDHDESLYHDKGRAVVKALIRCVADTKARQLEGNTDMEDAEVIACEREGALKAIMRRYRIGPADTKQMDALITRLTMAYRLHSQTIDAFSLSELHALAKKQRLGEKKVHYKRRKGHIITQLVDKELQPGSTRSVDTSRLEDELRKEREEKYGRLSTRELLDKARIAGGQRFVDELSEEQLDERLNLKDQIATALDDENPKKVLIWRLIEAAARPAPGEPQPGLHPKLAGAPSHLRPWAAYMDDQLKKVNSRAEKLTKHTKRLHDKVASIQLDPQLLRSGDTPLAIADARPEEE